LSDPTDRIFCAYPYQLGVWFSPSEPGLQTDTVTVTAPGITTSASVVGNALAREQAEQWVIDLGAGSRTGRILFDSHRDLIYVTDYGNDQVIVVSPVERRVISRINVGKRPMGMSMSIDSRMLYVAHSGESSIASIELDSRAVTRHLVPSLFDWPVEEPYYPFEIAVANERLALLSSNPPGLASGGPLYQVDLRTFEVAPRYDMADQHGYPMRGARSTMQISRDRSTIGIIPEYGVSWPKIVRYDTAGDSFFSVDSRDARDVWLNNNASRMISANVIAPALTVYDQDLRIIRPIELVESPALGVAFNPAAPKYVYALANTLQEVRLDLGRQTRMIEYQTPKGYLHDAFHSMAMSDNGEWLYTPLTLVAHEPPGKLLAVRVGPRGPADELAPVSQMNPLVETQPRNWWELTWAGSDDVSGVDYYAVEYRMGEQDDWKPWATTTATDALFTGAAPGQRYDFRVYGVDVAGNIERYPDGAEATTIAGADRTGLSQVFLPQVSAR
jgi:YVTN family beta-propeller protein